MRSDWIHDLDERRCERHDASGTCASLAGGAVKVPRQIAMLMRAVIRCWDLLRMSQGSAGCRFASERCLGEAGISAFPAFPRVAARFPQ